jgi:hypothetical protein
VCSSRRQKEDKARGKREITVVVRAHARTWSGPREVALTTSGRGGSPSWRPERMPGAKGVQLSNLTGDSVWIAGATH